MMQILGPGIRTGAILPGLHQARLELWNQTRLELCVELGQERIPKSPLHVFQQGRTVVMQEADMCQQQVEGCIYPQKLQLNCF